MSITQNTCGCGHTTTSQGAAAVSEPCTCGCCGPAPVTTEERIAELRRLRAALDQELAELEEV